MIWSHRVTRSNQFSLVKKLKRKRLTSVWTGLSFLFLIHRVVRCNKNIMFTSNSATCQTCKLNIGQSILKSFRTLRILTVRMLRHKSFSKLTHLPHSEHQPSGIGYTGNPLGIDHTGNRSDQEHGSVRARHHSDVSRSSRRDSNSNTIPLHHAEPCEHSPASMIRHRPARNRSRSYDSVSQRCRSRLTSRLRGKKKKSHKKRKHFSTSSSSSCRSSSSSLSESERERKKHKSKMKKKKHSKSHSTKRDKSKKKHKRKRIPSPCPSPLSSSVSSDYSSFPRRSPARKKSRIASRSPSPAGVYPQSASRTASPVLHWDHLSLYADSNDEFNSHSEDAQDLVPDNTDPVLESQSESLRRTWDLLTLSKKFFKLLPAYMFPRKLKSC